MEDKEIKYFNGNCDVTVKSISELNFLNQEEINNLATGPQDLFYEKLDYVNRTLESNTGFTIDVTNKWNWKPKTYDKMKKLLYKRLYLHKKTNGLDNLVNRTVDRVNYVNYIQRIVSDMEFERHRLKRLGVSKDVDVDVFKEKVKTFTESIIKQCNAVYEATGKRVSITPYFDKITNRNPKLYYDIKMSELVLSVFDGEKLIQEIELPQLHLIFYIELRRKLGTNNVNFSSCGTTDSMLKLNHPYIAVRGYDYGSVCLDKYFEDVNKALKNNDVINAAFVLLQWAQYYNIKHSNPYHQPHMSHIGMPESFSKEYVACQSKSAVLHHTERVLNKFANNLDLNQEDKAEFIVKSYDDIKCQFRDTSSHYIKNKAIINLLSSEEGFKLQALVLTMTEYYTDLVDKMEIVNEESMSPICSDIRSYFSLTVPYWSAFDSENVFNRELMYNTIFDRLYHFLFNYQIECKDFFYLDSVIQWFEDKRLIEKEKTNNDSVNTTKTIEELTKTWAYSSERG
tara:strand:- start:11988 stop:13520 length:1533 start_codon:yes stop_codon:yes gene_type:complete